MSSLRHVLALVLVSAAVVLGGAPACSQQTEGERCDSAKAGDADCESGLSCVSYNSLINGNGADRCCPAAGTETDKRCTRGTPSTGTGGSSSTAGSSGTAGSGGSAGSSSAGSSAGGSGGSSPSEAEAGAAGTPTEASAGAGGAG